MPIKKKYEDSLLVGGKPEYNLNIAIHSLDSAGFKKIKHLIPLFRVKGDWKPKLGTLYGDITLDFQAEGENTRILISVVAAVDNAFTLFGSPGERIKNKFLTEFTKLASSPQW